MLHTRLGWSIKAFALLIYWGLSSAESLYKCIVQGKIIYASIPEPPSACQRIDLKVIQPNPEEVARAIKENQMHEAIELERQKQRDKEQTKQAALKRSLIMKLNRLSSNYPPRRRNYYSRR